MESQQREEAMGGSNVSGVHRRKGRVEKIQLNCQIEFISFQRNIGKPLAGSRRKSSIKRQKNKGSNDENSNGKLNAERMDRNLLQEAYQFLVKKYCTDQKSSKQKVEEDSAPTDGHEIPMIMF